MHNPDGVFRIPLSKAAATSPVVTELLTCDSGELTEKLNLIFAILSIHVYMWRQCWTAQFQSSQA